MGILTSKKPLVICFQERDVSLVQKGNFYKSAGKD